MGFDGPVWNMLNDTVPDFNHWGGTIGQFVRLELLKEVILFSKRTNAHLGFSNIKGFNAMLPCCDLPETCVKCKEMFILNNRPICLASYSRAHAEYPFPTIEGIAQLVSIASHVPIYSRYVTQAADWFVKNPRGASEIRRILKHRNFPHLVHKTRLA